LAARGLTLGTLTSEIFPDANWDGLNSDTAIRLNIRFEGLDGSCWSNFLYFIGGYGATNIVMQHSMLKN
jgi:hypothetical protein